jgi:hypothetical protein
MLTSVHATRSDPAAACHDLGADYHEQHMHAMSAASPLRSPIAGDAARGPQDGAQDILGGIGLRAGGDRVGVRPVEVAEADAVVSYLGVVCCLL